MKLYNLYNDLILEEIDNAKLLNENVIDDIRAAMEGKYNVWIKYEDANGITDRYIQIHQLGTSKAGNAMISAYQIGGRTAKSKVNSQPTGWKQFRLDKIVPNSIRPTGMKYDRPISDLPSYGSGPKFNPDNRNMVGNIMNVKFK